VLSIVLTPSSSGDLAEIWEFIAADSAAPVWDEDGCCKWCGIAKSDLAVYPPYWFGCNLCESNIVRDDATPAPDNEFEPRHDREDA
jgi:hypothetical protein